VATLDATGEPQLTYEEVDTSLIPPRPRLYGLVGAELIEEVWNERQAARQAKPASGNGAPTVAAKVTST
jgi:succinate dehydrogenase / fumarate reductase flavoprotein subunit